jgi:hypothetical protein
MDFCNLNQCNPLLSILNIEKTPMAIPKNLQRIPQLKIKGNQMIDKFALLSLFIKWQGSNIIATLYNSL